MSIPIPLSRAQIEEIGDRVRADMTTYLGYTPIIRELSRCIGDEVHFQIGGLLHEHYSEAVQDHFTKRITIRFREVAGLDWIDDATAN